ncbi:zinc finger protein 502-like isoform X3 [Copidosoma floridanum]|uniref:zinc finger protein 502-like isoform X3 n=1 Tax=Copidosoma floridanum TaxID=29053 RepID=UPI000C6F9167|nr:zinc finger protein 502-like isoform X3 [Copidosoma floridanum]
MERIALKIETAPDGTNQMFAQPIMTYSTNIPYNSLFKEELIIIADDGTNFFEKQLPTNSQIIQPTNATYEKLVPDATVANILNLGSELTVAQGRTKIKCELYCVQCDRILDEETIVQKENLECKECNTRVQFKCKSCPKRYDQLRALHRHIRYECGSIKRYHCTHCQFKCIREIHLDLHIKKKHDAEYCFKCSKCGKVYDKRWCLNEHERSCEMPLKCEFCSFRTTQKQSLNYHIGAIHKLAHNVF